jgi:two-component system cell cycle sensor histidine kinase/response regulator CckA
MEIPELFDGMQMSPPGEGNPQPTWVFDLETLAFLDVNEAAVRKYGYSREQFLAMTVLEIRPPEDVPAFREWLAKVPRTDRSVIGRHRKSDGTLIDVEVHSNAVLYRGRPARLVLAVDVTDARRAEKEIADLNQRLRDRVAELETLLNLIPVGIAIGENRECSRVRVNSPLARLLGIPADANASVTAPATERPPYRLFRGGHELAPEEMPMQTAASKGIGSENVEVDTVFPDGRVIRFLTSTAPLFDQEGAPRGCITSFLDITARTQAEDQLREANETLRSLIEALPLAIVAMDFEGKVKSWNRAAQQMFGWTEQEVLGDVFPAVPENDQDFFRANLERARQGETLSGIERQRRRKDGSLMDVALWNTVQRDASGAPVGVISVIADITQRKHLEEQLRQSQKMEAVGRLAGGVAHDFNNLLTVVTGFSQLMLDGMPEDNPFREPIEEILKAGNRAAGLTNQLLAFSRRQMARPTIIDLNRVITDTERMLRRLISEDIELVLLLGSGLHNVKADAGQIEQVLMNLAINARDAMPGGGRLTIETSNVELRANDLAAFPELRPGAYVLLSFTDTGEGMDETTRARLFEPFFTTKGLGKGTGLGLSTVYGIVKQNRGDIAVWSQPGRGAAFRIYLPGLKAETEPPREAGKRPTVVEGSETVLLAEDEPGVRNMIRQVLVSQGYDVHVACDGRDALRVYSELSGHVDLLVTDVVMPHMNGQELARQLTVLQPDLKVVYISGYAEPVLARYGVSGRGAMFLQKPFTPRELRRRVREALGALR